MKLTNLTPIQLYDRGIYTLEEVIEMVPDLDPEWIAEQERLIAEAYQRYVSWENWEQDGERL